MVCNWQLDFKTALLDNISKAGLSRLCYLWGVMQIREMDLAELDQVIGLYLDGLKREMIFLESIFPGKQVSAKGVGELTKILLNMFKTNEGKIFVAIEGANCVGYCLVTKKFYPAEIPQMCGCINGVFVTQAFRKQGLGRKLYEASVNWLKQEGINYIELYHALNDDEAKGFWNTLGFKAVQVTCAKWIR